MAEALCVLIFPIFFSSFTRSSVFSRRDEHSQETPFQFGLLFHRSSLAQDLGDLVHHDEAPFFVVHFPSGEHDGDFHLVPGGKKPLHVADLGIKIMLATLIEFGSVFS